MAFVALMTGFIQTEPRADVTSPMTRVVDAGVMADVCVIAEEQSIVSRLYGLPTQGLRLCKGHDYKLTSEPPDHNLPCRSPSRRKGA
jgi:hypothetical protein